MVKDDSKKNPTFLALFKLLLGRVKAEIMLISWHIFMGFCIHPPLPQLPLPLPLNCHPHFGANERCSGGTYRDQVLFTWDI